MRAGLPPFLFIHGNRDTDVPPSQSKRMSRKLVALGVQSTVIIVKHAGHELKPVGGPISPSTWSLVHSLVSFFKVALQH